MENEEVARLEVSDDKIKEMFKLITSRPITQQSISVGKSIGKIAQWHIIEAIKLGLLPLRVGNYYLMKADVLDQMFKELDKHSIEQAKEE